VTLFDPSQFGDTLCVFHFQKKNIDPKKTASLFGDTIFGDTFSVSPSPKIVFGTFQLGIAQLVLQVWGRSGLQPPIFLLPLNYYYLVTLFVTLSTASDN
jgi:hypothetical protein